MKEFKLKNFTRGWIVGNFEPNLYKKDYEIGFKYYKLGDFERSHTHLLSEEITIILSGKVSMNGKEYTDGDVIIQEIGEFTDFKCISEKAITAVYRPNCSVPNDKYFAE